MSVWVMPFVDVYENFLKRSQAVAGGRRRSQAVGTPPLWHIKVRCCAHVALCIVYTIAPHLWDIVESNDSKCSCASCILVVSNLVFPYPFRVTLTARF